MTVEHILSEKGRDVVTIEADRTLAEAADCLARHRIGAIVVAGPDGSVRGILSERDIVRAVARQGALALDARVVDHMTADVVTCHRGVGIDSLMEQMTRGKFRHIPVLDGGRLIGIVSIGDVVKQRLAEMEAEQQALREYIATA